MNIEDVFSNNLNNLLYSSQTNKNQSNIHNLAVFHRGEQQDVVSIANLQGLSDHFDNINIYNWGATTSNSINIGEIVSNAQAKYIIPVFLGKYSIENLDIKASDRILFVSNKINENNIENEKVTNLGFQRHFSSLSTIRKVDDQSFGSMSLGKIRKNPLNIEPIIRDINYAFINLNVIKSSETPNVIDGYPTGLTVEEFCQITRYVGSANNLKGVFIFGDIKETCETEAKVIAMAIWYLLEGANQIWADHPCQSQDFSSFVVGYEEEDIVFKKNNSTQRMWAFIHDEYYACTHDEYLDTIEGNLPDRFHNLLH
jgi:hypothetical protein